ncbi:hypothetical protein NLI96_g4614 [Meripilus lineatus]|uniref:DUF6533 domain-containing protein n=1 Tax=Meripilus lineatus TaxID=2056292 RepID=A0AAD5YJX9_9APHY|nr:hypothetical protein NLI96_g4614 [Physisporinus lineatus]
MPHSILTSRSDQSAGANPSSFGFRGNLNLILATSSLALLVYDHLLTFPTEVQLIWRRKFSVVTILFLLVRYFTLVSKVVYVACMMGEWSTEEYARLEIVNDALAILGGIGVYGFNILRIYALWDKNRRLALLIAIVGYGIPLTGVVRIFSMTFRYIHIKDCILPSSLAAEFLVIILTLIKTLRSHKPVPGIPLQRRLSQLFLRNGLVYFMVLATADTLVFIGWLVVGLTLPTLKAASDLWLLDVFNIAYFLDAASAILITRFILSLRSFDLPSGNVPGECPSYTDQSAWSSRAAFFNRIKSIDVVGSMGSPLDHGEEMEDD